MARKNNRAHIRLRVENGKAKLKLAAGEHYPCTLLDVSEGGCRVRFLMSMHTPDQIEDYKVIFAAGTQLTIDFHLHESLQEFSSLAMSRNVNEMREGLDVGLAFNHVAQQNIIELRNMMLTCASERVRRTTTIRPKSNMPLPLPGPALPATAAPAGLASTTKPATQLPDERPGMQSDRIVNLRMQLTAGYAAPPPSPDDYKAAGIPVAKGQLTAIRNSTPAPPAVKPKSSTELPVPNLVKGQTGIMPAPVISGSFSNSGKSGTMASIPRPPAVPPAGQPASGLIPILSVLPDSAPAPTPPPAVARPLSSPNLPTQPPRPVSAPQLPVQPGIGTFSSRPPSGPQIPSLGGSPSSVYKAVPRPQSRPTFSAIPRQSSASQVAIPPAPHPTPLPTPQPIQLQAAPPVPPAPVAPAIPVPTPVAVHIPPPSGPSLPSIPQEPEHVEAPEPVYTSEERAPSGSYAALPTVQESESVSHDRPGDAGGTVYPQDVSFNNQVKPTQAQQSGVVGGARMFASTGSLNLQRGAGSRGTMLGVPKPQSEPVIPNVAPRPSSGANLDMVMEGSEDAPPVPRGYESELGLNEPEEFNEFDPPWASPDVPVVNNEKRGIFASGPAPSAPPSAASMPILPSPTSNLVPSAPPTPGGSGSFPVAPGKPVSNPGLPTISSSTGLPPLPTGTVPPPRPPGPLTPLSGAATGLFGGKELVDTLVVLKMLTPDVGKEMSTSALRKGEILDRVLAQSGKLTYAQVARGWSQLSDIPVFDLNNYILPQAVKSILPYPLLEKYEAVPFRIDAEKLCVALTRPLSARVVEDLQMLAGKKLKLYIAAADQIWQRLAELQALSSGVTKLLPAAAALLASPPSSPVLPVIPMQTPAQAQAQPQGNLPTPSKTQSSIFTVIPGMTGISNQTTPTTTPAHGVPVGTSKTPTEIINMDPMLQSGVQREGVVHICPVTYFFCDQQGQSLVNTQSSGWIVDITEGRLKLEGPPLDRMLPQDPKFGGSYMNLAIAPPSCSPIHTLCSVHNADAISGSGVIGPPVAFMYNLDILHIAPHDRAQLVALSEKIAESRNARGNRRAR